MLQEHSEKLLSICENLIGASQLNLISPTHKLIKEGSIIKISARDGSHQERYLFLVSESLYNNKQVLDKNQMNINKKGKYSPYLMDWNNIDANTAYGCLAPAYLSKVLTPCVCMC